MVLADNDSGRVVDLLIQLPEHHALLALQFSGKHRPRGKQLAAGQPALFIGGQCHGGFLPHLQARFMERTVDNAPAIPVQGFGGEGVVPQGQHGRGAFFGA